MKHLKYIHGVSKELSERQQGILKYLNVHSPCGPTQIGTSQFNFPYSSASSKLNSSMKALVEMGLVQKCTKLTYEITWEWVKLVKILWST